MENRLTDEDLVTELQKRLQENKDLLNQERKLTTELNDVNEKLLESEHLKSNFLSNIRNEINNPIASILELAKNISEGSLSKDEVKDLAGLIYLEAFDLDFQLRNIFFSAEIEAGESPLSIVSINIYSLIESILTSFKKRMDRKGIHLIWDNSIIKHRIFKTDSEKLHLIICNLIANAIQFSNQGGTIEVCSQFEGDELVICVKDTGIGISKENQQKIYDRFHQIEEGSTKTYGGHGLGLSITKALLEIIEGRIELESDLGKGSCFKAFIKELDLIEGDTAIFSTDGNDFIFDQDDDEMLF
ncbi:MAG: sensor histidine kinase [Crocinitomicaceae bacterium]